MNDFWEAQLTGKPVTDGAEREGKVRASSTF